MASAGRKLIRVDVVSDTVWPWCYIGKRRLEKAISLFSGRNVDFEISWRPFQLNPNASEEGVDKMNYYEMKFGKERTERMIPYMKQIGASENINFSYGGKVANTLNSHRLIEYAKKKSGLKCQDQVFMICT